MHMDKAATSLAYQTKKNSAQRRWASDRPTLERSCRSTFASFSLVSFFLQIVYPSNADLTTRLSNFCPKASPLQPQHDFSCSGASQPPSWGAIRRSLSGLLEHLGGTYRGRWTRQPRRSHIEKYSAKRPWASDRPTLERSCRSTCASFSLVSFF